MGNRHRYRFVRYIKRRLFFLQLGEKGRENFRLVTPVAPLPPQSPVQREPSAPPLSPRPSRPAPRRQGRPNPRTHSATRGVGWGKAYFYVVARPPAPTRQGVTHPDRRNTRVATSTEGGPGDQACVSLGWGRGSFGDREVGRDGARRGGDVDGWAREVREALKERGRGGNGILFPRLQDGGGTGGGRMEGRGVGS